jgi:hypothetical protein
MGVRPDFGFQARANRIAVRALCCVPALLGLACGGRAQTPKPAQAAIPTPATVTVKEPGGDAQDPHAAALERLANAPWGTRNDRDGQLNVPLPDSDNWKRVRYFGVEHFVGFRYGDDHHAMVIAFTRPLPAGTQMKSDTCMRSFEAWGLPQTHPFDVKFSPFETNLGKWQGKILESRMVDGRLNLGFSSSEFSGAWAAYPAYADGCLVLAVAVPWREHKELAQKLRDRWVSEGFPLAVVASDVRPERK